MSFSDNCPGATEATQVEDVGRVGVGSVVGVGAVVGEGSDVGAVVAVGEGSAVGVAVGSEAGGEVGVGDWVCVGELGAFERTTGCSTAVWAELDESASAVILAGTLR